jgi:hypothetical protein
MNLSFQALSLALPLGIAQLALDGRNDPAQFPLNEIVLCPRFEGGNRGFLTQSSRNIDEGDIRGSCAQNLERLRPRKPRHRIVGYDHVPVRGIERPIHRGGIVDAEVCNVEAASFQFANDECGVVFRILDDQSAKRWSSSSPPL